jgi:phage baseplate assembly protein V
MSAPEVKISNMISRGTLADIDPDRKMQTVQARLLAGETKNGLEYFEPYGITSVPNNDAELVAVFLDGDRSNGLVICIADRRFRLQGMKTGEVALHDDQGQKVHLTRDGIVIEGGGKPLIIQDVPTATIKADMKVRFETPLMECTGTINDMCDSPEGKTMSGMREIYNQHDHAERNVVGGPTSIPNQQM